MASYRNLESLYSWAATRTYQVFLSFRGEDTRASFTDHLYTALKRAGIVTFIDHDGIEGGENITVELREAIRQSRVSIVVFSRDFASSRWCLGELELILERRRAVGHVVLPVFYHVDPSEVRSQSGGAFAAAFARHEACFDKDKVDGWREALRDVAGLKGMVLQKNQRESQFIEDIVKEIEKKLKPSIINPSPSPVGMDSCTKDINSWFEDEVGTTTMYGIGKTSIAKTVYGLNLDRFEAQVGPSMEIAALDVMAAQLLLEAERVKLSGQKVEAWNNLLITITTMEKKDMSNMTKDQIKRHNNIIQKLWALFDPTMYRLFI